ncbi:hypothetical protein [Aquimarina sp. RZ0]|uniref:hypothetical protein n=1 Tax=Aquimarina sp. RZ0 TaxID=2607730 RepID=UPI0011F09EF4|nr:hypothetical protein [Aquimarina sp. RZ0]KAA1247269.1 hypothetical protein F0000_03745 [Aquimarina sp. RZ0]
MKKKAEAELISIAHRILQLKDGATLSKLQEEARQLYEKLTILNFAESHFSDPQPTIGQIRSILEAPIAAEKKVIKPTPVVRLDPAPEVEKEPEPLQETKKSEYAVSEIVKEPSKPEIIIEKINEKVSEDLFVPATKVTEEDIIISESVYEKNDREETTGSVPQSMPILDKINTIEEKPKSLNDQLKKGINIGLNDRLAFIKHLFDGSSTDYNRVLSQLNTLNSKSGARQFVKNMVKPDYNNWEGKEEYEERFMQIVSSKYEF